MARKFRAYITKFRFSNRPDGDFYPTIALHKKTVLNVLTQISQNEAVSRLMSNLITIAFLLIGLFLALGILGLDKTVTSLLAGAGILGLAIGLAFQDPILNIISGVIMSFKKPFNIGDTILHLTIITE